MYKESIFLSAADLSEVLDLSDSSPQKIAKIVLDISLGHITFLDKRLSLSHLF